MQNRQSTDFQLVKFHIFTTFLKTVESMALKSSFASYSNFPRNSNILTSHSNLTHAPTTRILLSVKEPSKNVQVSWGT